LKSGYWKAAEKNMFIAMNRFCIVKGKEIEFERIWAERDSHPDEIPGFKEFNLLRGPRRKTTRCTPPIQSGRANSISRTGQNRKPSARPTPTREAPKTSIKGNPMFEGFETVL